MRYGIVGGSGIYKIPGVETKEEIVKTQYGEAKVYIGLGDYSDIVFLARHGVDHSIPPHKVNYRANITALKKLGIEKVFGTYAVGSLTTLVPPGHLVILDQYIDTNFHRTNTFFQGEEYGLGHTDMTEPYCTTLSKLLYPPALEKGLPILPDGTYVCFNGPRFETSAEIRMYAHWGGDVIGMTGGTETALAREAGLHYGAVAFSINYGAGLRHTEITFEKPGLDENLTTLLMLMIETLRTGDDFKCGCDRAVRYSEDPKIDLFT